MKRRFGSITHQMMAVFCVFLIILFAGIAGMNHFFYKSFKIWDNERKIIQQGEEIAKHFATLQLTKKTVADYETEIAAATENYNLSIRIATGKYNILIDSSSYRTKKRTKLAEDIITLIEAKEEELNSSTYCLIPSYGKAEHYQTILYIRKLEGKYYLTISRTLRSIDEDIHTSNSFLLISAVITSVFGLTSIYFFSKRFTEPILKINSVAQKISTLEFDHRLDIDSKDELGELCRSMNLISRRLSESIGQLQMELQRRKQLIRDMSHELKTPITAVKGYTEALKYGVIKDPNQVQRYYNVIIQECDRMNTLIYELMELSRIEAADESNPFGYLSIEQLMGELKEQYRIPCEDKKIEWIYEFEEEYLFGNERILKRAIKNIIENAIRHVNEAGCIRIRTRDQEDQVLLSIYNTGSSIPNESIRAIWDVFYKIDESRKREENTYGIGLAIVKSAMDLHHGTVEVENVDGGVEFRLILPKERILPNDGNDTKTHCSKRRKRLQCRSKMVVETTKEEI